MIKSVFLVLIVLISIGGCLEDTPNKPTPNHETYHPSVALSSPQPAPGPLQDKETWTATNVPDWVEQVDAPHLKKFWTDAMIKDDGLYKGLWRDSRETHVFVDGKEWGNLTRFQANNHLGLIASLAPHNEQTIFVVLDSRTGEKFASFSGHEQSGSIAIKGLRTRAPIGKPMLTEAERKEQIQKNLAKTRGQTP